MKSLASRARIPDKLPFGAFLAILPLLLVPFQATSAPVVVNGGFEADVVSGEVSVAGGGLMGWTVGPSGSYPALVHEDGLHYVPYGDQLILLGHYFGGLGYIEQTISGFTPGQSYLLAFAIATSDSGCGGGCGDSEIQVSFQNGSSTPAANFTAPPAGGPAGYSNWVEYSHSFVATGSDVTVRFAQFPIGTGGGVLGGTGLDHISITADAESTPEPPPGILLALGAAAAALHRMGSRCA